MILKRLDDILGSPAEVSAQTWTSRRLLLAKDGMGFSLHDTLIHAGTRTEMEYKHHLEAVYCIRGEGTLTDLASGRVHTITEGTVYALDQHDRHVLEAKSELRLVCVFTPAVVGDEVHRPDGSYPPPGG